MTWLKGHWQLLLLTAAVVLLWDTPVLVPLKILVVLFHEISHGVAAVLTGGEIVSLTVSPDQGGLAVTRGGSRFWILTAGYLGSLLIGVGLLLGALRSRADKALVAALGVVTLALTALYIRELFAVLFCLGIGLSLLAISRFLPRTANDLVLRIIGLTSMIYVPRDIFSDTIDRAYLRSDAYMLAEYLGGTGQIWG
ncbi:MAG: M50 family metallopeptidase, partial [Pseudomonadota bacterium]